MKAGWKRAEPKEAGHYWFRRGLSATPRVVRLGYPGLSGALLDCAAHAGDPMTPKEMLADHPNAQFYFPALEPPDLRPTDEICRVALGADPTRE